MRLFLAVKPDRPAEAQLARRVLDLQRALGDLASILRWTPAANVHATIHFLGEIDAGRVDGLRAALGSALPQRAFEMSLGEAGAFPEFGAVQVLWLAVLNGVELLRSLHHELGERLGGAGVAIDARPFSPHVTVARLRDRRDRRPAKQLRERLPRGPAPAISWMADHVTLYRSDLSGPVPRYDAMHEIALAQTPASA